jgi:hypothetical protein
MCLNDSLDFGQRSWVQSVRRSQRNDWFQPELGLAPFARHMDMNPLLLVREEIESIPFFPED